jgi:hypothetical protein
MIRLFHRQKTIYYRLFLFFVILAVAVILILSIAFRNIYRNALLGELTGTFEKDLKTKAVEIDKLVEEIDYVYMSVISDADAIKFMSLDTWNPMDEYLVRRRFSRFRNIHSRVLSMYLYNSALGYFVSTNSEGRDYADFPDHELVEGVKERRLITIRKMPSPGGDTREKIFPLGKVFSFIYNTFNSKDGKLENSVIINLGDPIGSELTEARGMGFYRQTPGQPYC